MSFIKTITVEDYYTQEEATRLSNVVKNLSFTQHEFGKEIDNFNFTPENSDVLFSKVLNRPVEIIEEQSGVFREPELFIHFESFESLNDWLFVVALESSTFNLYYHLQEDMRQCAGLPAIGARSALEGYKYNYRNLFEWHCAVNYLLEPGQGIFFRPWMFHSFDQGLIQTFRLREKDVN